MKMDMDISQPTLIEEIMEILPQRYPMIMLDKILKKDEKKIVAIKNISGNEPCFEGHFPNMKIYPGVLLTESLAQASIVFFHQFNQETSKRSLPVLYHTNIKFKKIVVPGDQLIIHVNLLK